MLISTTRGLYQLAEMEIFPTEIDLVNVAKLAPHGKDDAGHRFSGSSSGKYRCRHHVDPQEGTPCFEKTVYQS